MSSLPARSTEPRPSRLPGSDELFRRTAARPADAHEAGIRMVEPAPAHVEGTADARAGGVTATIGPAPDAAAERRPTGRERHDEKITVYVSNDELIDLEHARLTLKRLGVKADRGRIVREALAEVIGDLERNGEGAVLVRRLRAE